MDDGADGVGIEGVEGGAGTGAEVGIAAFGISIGGATGAGTVLVVDGG
jgi:hypothetical protein